jgi:hypothetical protein
MRRSAAAHSHVVILPLLASQSIADVVDAFLDRSVVEIDQDDIEVLRGSNLGDSATHNPSADDTDRAH